MSELIKNRNIWLVSIAGFALGAVEFSLVAHLTLYLTEALLYSVVTAGVILAVTQAGGILGKPLAGVLSDRCFGNSRRTVFVLWSAVASATFVLTVLLGDRMPWALYPVLFIAGMTTIGWGGIYLTLTAELAGVEMAGTAIGIVGAIDMIGFIIGPILFGYVVDITESYQLAWLICAAVAAVSAVSVYLIREEKRKPRRD